MKYSENYIEGNHSKGIEIEPKGIVLHHNYLPKHELIRQCTESTGFINARGLKVPPASYHCVGWKNGERTQFVNYNLRAWHAGESEFKGWKHCNNFMIGYSFHGNTNEEELTKEQIESFIEWLIPIVEQYKFTIDWIPDHKTVSPGRKVDLNEYQYQRVLMAIKYLWL
jgi:AmpD protein